MKCAALSKSLAVVMKITLSLLGNQVVGKHSHCWISTTHGKREVPEEIAEKRLMMLDAVVAGNQKIPWWVRRAHEENLGRSIPWIRCDSLYRWVAYPYRCRWGRRLHRCQTSLKPALARGEIQVIGATTLDEYQKYIERRSSVNVVLPLFTWNEPSDDSWNLKRPSKTLWRPPPRGNHDAAIEAAVQLSVRYITSRKLPEKSHRLYVEKNSCKKPVWTAVVNIHRSKTGSRSGRTLAQKKDDAIREQKFEEAARLRKEQAKRDKFWKLRQKVKSKPNENSSRRLRMKISQKWYHNGLEFH